MKRIALVALCFAFLLTITGCVSNISSGTYYAGSDFDENITPYLYLNSDDQRFSLGAGLAVSYGEQGSFTVKDGKVIAESQSTTYVFEIKDSKTLILIDNGDNKFLVIPENTEFVLSDESR